MRRNKPAHDRRTRASRRRRSSVEVDVQSLVQLENRCGGCAKGQKCCCSSYEVCVTEAEVQQIIRFLPEAARYCPGLRIDGGYDSVFEQEEPGLFSIDTDEDGLCVFAYWSRGRTHCSLHSAALSLGHPLEKVKPKVCMLWPLHFSDGDEVLSTIDDALLFACNGRRPPGSSSISPGFVEAIDRVYGEGCGDQVRTAAEGGERRTLLVIRR